MTPTGGHNATVGFQATGYDPSQPLTIDPVLSYGSYLGGSGTDQGYGVAVDAAGNLYLTGATASSNFPTTAGPSYAGNTDAFVAKLNAAGNQLQFTGTNPDAQVVGEQQLTSHSSYFIGSDPSAWHPDVAQYGQVATRNLYPGVDTRYYGTPQRQFEYDLVVAPGADLIVIHLTVQGAACLHVDPQGNHRIHCRSVLWHGESRQPLGACWERASVARESHLFTVGSSPGRAAHDAPSRNSRLRRVLGTIQNSLDFRGQMGGSAGE
jgi:hypothetical protein